MTSVVGVLCKDGVVLGTDSSATFSCGQQFHTIEQPTEKLQIIGNIIIAGTGPAGLNQRFCAIAKSAWNQKVFQKPVIEVVKELSRSTIADFGYTYLKPGQYGALVAFPAEHRPRLCEFSLNDFQPELKTEQLWYGSMGGAQPITDPFLAFIREVFWRDGPPSVQDAIFAVVWTLQHAIDINPGGVNGPLRVGVLERGSKGELQARNLADEELDEHRQNIEEVKQRLREFRLRHQSTGETEAPDVPRP